MSWDFIPATMQNHWKSLLAGGGLAVRADIIKDVCVGLGAIPGRLDRVSEKSLRSPSGTVQPLTRVGARAQQRRTSGCRKPGRTQEDQHCLGHPELKGRGASTSPGGSSVYPAPGQIGSFQQYDSALGSNVH